MNILRALSLATAASVVLSSAPAFAADPQTTAWTNAFTPSAVYAGYAEGETYASGATYPANWKSGAASGAPTCEVPSLIQFKLDSGNVMSLALAAMLSGKQISCLVTDACDGKYPVAKQCKIVK